MVAKGVGGEMDLEFGTSRCKRLHVEWKTNKVLLYSTGSYIQYPVINHNEKEYITESPCCTAEINNIVNQLFFNNFFFFKKKSFTM